MNQKAMLVAVESESRGNLTTDQQVIKLILGKNQLQLQ